MSQFFRQAQDPVSCATHAWGAVAAFFGGMVLLLRALWAGANMAALAAAMVFAFSLDGASPLFTSKTSNRSFKSHSFPHRFPVRAVLHMPLWCAP